MTFIVDHKDRFWDDSQEKGWFRFPSPLRYVLLLLLLVGLVVGVWYVLPSSPSLNKADLPLVRADETPFKIKAEDQGVPGVNHQDKLVYGRIRSDENKPTVEHILPPPEAPLAHSAPPPVQMVDQYLPEDLDLTPGAEQASAPAAPATPPPASIEALLEEISPDEVAPAVDKPAPSKKGKVAIQLGSLKSHALAKEEWDRLSKKHKAILEGFEPLIQKVDLGSEQGIYYRLRASGFDTTDSAEKACAALKQEKTDCRVVR